MSFKDWFKNSKVVDSKGKPLVVYHGSPIKFNTFNPDLMNYGSISRGFCFFTNKKSAYPNCAKDYAGKNGYIYECYLRIEKPLHVRYGNTSEEYYHTPIHYWDTCQSDIRREFRKGDYDGIIIENENKDEDDSIIFLVSNANQIKSVNAKTFSNSENIYENIDNPFSNSIIQNIVYHGTNRNFKKFNTKKISTHTNNNVYGKGVYFIGDIKTIYSKLNEELEKFLEESAMYQSNQPTFEDFYKYVIKNPKAKKSYFEFSEFNLRIPSDTILHDKKKHGMTIDCWQDCLSNLTNIQNARISYKKVSNENIALIRTIGSKNYGISLMLCNNYCIITTAFYENPKMIDNWIKVGSRSQNAIQPTNSFHQNKSDSVVLSSLDPNDIITYILQKLKR